ncbi:MAG: substrate-binding domain-containing protein [Candidatus Omnitrophota bacterium]
MFRKLRLGLGIIALSAVVFIAGVKAEENKTVILATTTSVQDTGLLDVLIDAFQKKTGFTVKAIAVGTGQALQMGRTGEADILWVHSPADEEQFVNEGYGTDRTTFMHNDFVILGPKNDPAKVMGTKKAAEAFKKIAGAKALFISRGDNSGTHKKEKTIWKEAGVLPDKKAYIEVGQGMAQTIAVANEKQGYVLADRSSYLSLKKSMDLVIIFEGDEALINRYSLILVNPAKFPKVNPVRDKTVKITNGCLWQPISNGVNSNGARALFDFLLSKDSKVIVENFGKEKFGQQLFFWDLKGNI